MNAKLVGNLLIVACVAALAWWGLRFGTETQTAPRSPRAQLVNPGTVQPADQSAEVVVPVAPRPSAMVTAIDPQAELVTAIPAMLQVAQAGDWLTFYTSFLENGQTVGMDATGTMTTHAMGIVDPMASFAAFLQVIQTQGLIPTFSDTNITYRGRDEATYTLPSGGQAHFIKSDGRWLYSIHGGDQP